MDDYGYDEEQIYFDGTCTCEHETGEHGWGHCDQPDCPCEAGWCE